MYLIHDPPATQCSKASHTSSISRTPVSTRRNRLPSRSSPEKGSPLRHKQYPVKFFDPSLQVLPVRLPRQILISSLHPGLCPGPLALYILQGVKYSSSPSYSPWQWPGVFPCPPQGWAAAVLMDRLADRIPLHGPFLLCIRLSRMAVAKNLNLLVTFFMPFFFPNFLGRTCHSRGI